MSEFNDMLKRIKIDDIIAYLMSGTESEIEHSKSYETKIKNAYEKIFTTLENMCPSTDRHNDDLYDAVLNFSIVHNEVYLEMGIIVGFQLYKNIEQGYKDFSVNGIDTFFKESLDVNKCK